MSLPWVVHDRDPDRTTMRLGQLRVACWVAYCGDQSPELQRSPLAGAPTCKRCIRIKRSRFTRSPAVSPETARQSSE